MPETTDPPGGGSENPDDLGDRRKMSAEDFERFLGCLSPDAEEANRRYLRLHKKLVGFFGMKGISDADAAADETIDRAAVISRDGRSIPDMERFCIGIAKNIARERRRREQRESSGFLNFVRELSDNSDEQIERIQRILKPCFAQLAFEDQRLLEDYCGVLRGRARAEHRRRLAERLGTTVLGLRMRVTRLRGALAACVKKLTGGG
jgi:hypothetical protein